MISVHGHLAPCPLDLWEAAHHGEDHTTEETAHLIVTGKQKKEKGAGVSISPSRPSPDYLTVSH
jgi:hypothetical protein